MKNNIRFLLICSILLCFASFSTFAQSRSKEEKQADKTFIKGEYQNSIDLYNQALLTASEESKARIHYKIAESFRLSNRLYLTIEHYLKAIEGNLEEDIQKQNAMLYLAFAYKMNSKYEEATQQFSAYLQLEGELAYPDKANLELKNLAEIKTITAIENEYIELFNCDSVNSEGAEYAPVLLKDESNSFSLFYTSSKGETTFSGTGYGYTRLFKLEIEDSLKNTGNVSLVDIPLPIFKESKYNIGTCTFTDNGNTMIFARGNSGFRRDKQKEVSLYITYFKDSIWSEPELLPFSSEETWESSPAFSPDGKRLYFASNRPGGKGGIDLYSVERRRSTGEWTEPKNLGNKINSPGNEMFPYVTEDGKLYFASDGHPGLGGLDNFIAYKVDKRTVVENVGLQFNSPFDDFGLIYNDTLSGYFTSNRPEGKGNDDIYFFLDKTPPKFDLFVELALRYGKDGGDKDGNFFAGEPILNANVTILKKKEPKLITDDEKLEIKKEVVARYRETVNDSLVNVVASSVQTEMVDNYKKELDNSLKEKLEKEAGGTLAREYVNNVADSLIAEYTQTIRDSIAEEYSDIIKETADSLIADYEVNVEDSLNNPEEMPAEFEEIGELTTGRYGQAKFKMDPGAEYTFIMSKEDVLTKRVTYKAPEIDNIPVEELVSMGIEDSTFKEDYELDKPNIGDIISMRDGENDYQFEEILYDYDSYYFDNQENPQIDKLVQFLSDNPNISVEVSSHCDDRGSDLYNLMLSQKRANFVVEYLKNKGIPESQVVGRGYGKFKIKIENAQSEEDHQTNRRTEIKITEIKSEVSTNEEETTEKEENE
ncbi:OmpA family protein [Chondrinema litorale]|uniref:OmpA family protein n=1 Tax=Chondrinema litorale TaxID=2994555 RepID=UPI00254358EF|nr:OmpA family protein [Chondrinema litorale]UZR92625.1 OmpA family protein [Chondrinema litorale]